MVESVKRSRAGLDVERVREHRQDSRSCLGIVEEVLRAQEVLADPASRGIVAIVVWLRGRDDPIKICGSRARRMRVHAMQGRREHLQGECEQAQPPDPSSDRLIALLCSGRSHRDAI